LERTRFSDPRDAIGAVRVERVHDPVRRRTGSSRSPRYRAGQCRALNLSDTASHPVVAPAPPAALTFPGSRFLARSASSRLLVHRPTSAPRPKRGYWSSRADQSGRPGPASGVRFLAMIAVVSKILYALRSRCRCLCGGLRLLSGGISGLRSPHIANMLSICAGIAVSFTLNTRYNFQRRDAVIKRATKFVGGRAVWELWPEVGDGVTG